MLALGLTILMLQAATPETPRTDDTDAVARIQKEFTSVVEKIKPSVVEIRSVRRVFKSSQTKGVILQQMVDETIILSGVVVREGGYIVTASEPLQRASKIHVKTSDGKALVAELKGSDTETGLALIKVGVELPMLPCAGEGDVKPGTWIAAIGNSFGMSGSVSFGCISGVDRAVESSGKKYYGLLQFSAPVNPGDAGGILADFKGNAVGIIFSSMEKKSEEGGGVSGIGFAVPMWSVKFVADRLATDQKVQRGWLGIGAKDVDQDLASQLKIESGAVVTSVDKGGPAEAAGLKIHDVLLTVGEEKIVNVHRMMQNIVRIQNGVTLKIGVLRGGERKEFEITVRTR